MRLLHIVGDSAYGGGGMMVEKLARFGHSEGWRVGVLTTDPRFRARLAGAGIEVVDLDVVWRPIRPVRDLRGLLRLKRYLADSEWDLVHTHTSKAGFIGRLAGRLARVPVVVHTVHGFAFHERSPALTVRTFAWLERTAARWCDRVVTVSAFHRRWALDLGIGTPDSIVAIPNGIDRRRTIPERSRADVRLEMSASESELVLVAIGRLAPGKGLEVLLRSLPHIRARLGRRVSLWLVGEGPQRAELERDVARLGLEDSVRMTGYRTDVADLLGAADLVMLPTFREGLSISLLEAMAAGKPIVTTTIGSNREVTREGEAALLVEPGDPKALAEAVARLARDPDLAQRLGRRAAEIVDSEYHEERMLERYRRLYGELTAHRGVMAGDPSTELAG